jgi:hypothetical protein
MAKLPLPPPAGTLRHIKEPVWADDVPEVLWRIRPTKGPHPYPWNGFRDFGPLPSARFDPHRPPPHVQIETVAYFGVDWHVCLAEVFQQTRIIDPHTNDVFLTGIQLDRAIRLIDLRGSWPITVGASHHINTGRKDHCRAWARALRQAWPHADGLASVGVNAGTVVTLYNPAKDALGRAAVFDRPLADAAIENHLATAAEHINFDLI